MRLFTMALLYINSDVLFQAELLLLLASILLSFMTSNTRFFFAASAASLFTNIATTILTFSRDWIVHDVHWGAIATPILSGMLLATFAAAMASGMRTFIVHTHTALTFALCTCLSVGLGTVLADVAQPVGSDVLDQSRLRAVIFSAMHLVAAVLASAEACCGRPRAPNAAGPADDASTFDHDRKTAGMV